MKLWRIGFGIALVSSLGVTAWAETPRPRPAPTRAEAITRVGKLHNALIAVTNAALPAKNRLAEDVQLDTSSSTSTTNCATSGSMTITYTAASSGGPAQYSITFNTCQTGGDTYNGNVEYTFTASSSGGTTTKVAAYKRGALAVTGIDAGQFDVGGLSVTVTVVSQPKDAGGSSAITTTSTVDGNVTVDGATFKLAGERYF